MIASDIIRRKRDGLPLSDDDILGFLSAYTRGDVPDYQMAAMAMAVFFRGLLPEELAAWTRAMLHSGDVIDLTDLPGRKVDKHSTGGVGDKISIPLAPLVAACGVLVPMISGRGLGHTGGTLDKLESIPGFRVDLDVPTFRRLVGELGCCLIGQTERVAPADRKLYALRDVTSTVDSIPLIASSIMSKKLAEGIDALVLDVKFGTGAFMRERDKARELAQTMVGIGRSFGKDVVALLTDMNQPLGRCVGNSLEIIESLDVLQGNGPPDVVELTVALGAEMLVLGHVAGDIEDGRRRIEKAISSGEGFRVFERIVEAQGGDPRALTDRALLPTARRTQTVASEKTGWVSAFASDEIGRAAMLLGAGRYKVDDTIDPAVGVVLHAKTGDRIEKGQPLATFHVNAETSLPEARRKLLAAISVSDAPPPPSPLVVERIV